jgi:hypothetical protein
MPRPLTPGQFWQKVDKREPGECWPWLGVTNFDGYGYFRRDGRTVMAHRYAYELEAGPIPEGLEPDHLCRNRACCNPAHMEPVTHRENVLRGEGTAAVNARKTHCPREHELSGDNLYVNPSGHRRCRTCQREADARYQQQQRAA